MILYTISLKILTSFYGFVMLNFGYGLDPTSHFRLCSQIGLLPK